jgi:hypothetical protein
MKFLNILTTAVAVAALTIGSFRAELELVKKPNQHKAMHWIISVTRGEETHGAGCTAYAVGPHTLLTAQHCDIGATKLYVDSNKMDAKNDVATSYQIISKTFDGEDHMLIDLRGIKFESYITLSAKVRTPRQGEHVYFWGNPRGVVNQYHEGHIMGTVQFENDPEDDDPVNAKGDLYIAALAADHGDSGSAVFSERDGHLVGVLSLGGFLNGGGIGIFPIKFTQAQIDNAMKN